MVSTPEPSGNPRIVRVSKGIHLEGLLRLEDAIGKTDFDFFTQDHAQQAFNDEQAYKLLSLLRGFRCGAHLAWCVRI